MYVCVCMCKCVYVCVHVCVYVVCVRVCVCVCIYVAPRCPQQRQRKKAVRKHPLITTGPGPVPQLNKSVPTLEAPIHSQIVGPILFATHSEGTTTLSVRVPTVSLHIHGRCTATAFVSRSSQLPTRTQVVYCVCDSESHMHLRAVSQGFAADGACCPFGP